MVAPITESPDRLEVIVESGGIPSESMYIWMVFVTELLLRGYSGTITTAALTGPGTQGSMTFEHGILIAQTQAT